ncbi:MAG: hypothetical protein OXG72_19055 [Acidobacteria bacterium]|nr:hypothetical protein [Acidobacteriota bacterium]
MGINPVIKYLGEVQARLYYHLTTLQTIAVGMGAVYAYRFDMDAVPPYAPWLRDLFAIVAPGVAPSILEFPARYPVLFVIFMIVSVTIQRAGAVLKAAQGDAGWALSNGKPVPAVPVWAGAIPRVRWLIVVVGICAGIAAVDLRSTAGCHGGCRGGEPSEPPGCGPVRGECRPGPGETVRVTMRADRARNATGILLEAGAWYTARHIHSEGWRDEDIRVGPTGFRFCENSLGLSRFWWVEWLRPYPQGEWFEVLGRIDGDRLVFPIMDSCDASKPWLFKAPEGGELVLLVNDAIYSNNAGVMTLEIKRSVGESGQDRPKRRRWRDCRPPFEGRCRHR